MQYTLKRTFLPAGLLLLCLLFVYYPVLAKLIHDWEVDPNYSHGFFIPFICGYMIWSRRQRLGELQVTGSNWGLLLLCSGLLLLFVSWIGSEYFSQGFSLLVVLMGLVWFLAGWPYLQALFVPIIYLLFMVPLPAIIWNRLAFPLSLLASRVAANVMDLLGITVLREGNILILPNITLQVADACSGLRSLTTLLALSAFLAYLSPLQTGARWVLFLSAVPIALFCNIIRLVGTGVLARHFGAPAAQGFVHELSGWLVFILGLFFLLGVSRLLSVLYSGHPARNESF